MAPLDLRPSIVNALYFNFLLYICTMQALEYLTTSFSGLSIKFITHSSWQLPTTTNDLSHHQTQPSVMAKRTYMARTQVFEERTDIFRFLELPGEIRNAIYNYCEPTAPQNFVHGHKIDRQTPSHTVLNLAGVNKQLRSGFLPLCQNGFTHRVQIADLSSYMQTFIAPHSTVSRTIEIEVEAGIKKAVDILPLMTLVRKHGGLVLEIKDSSPVPSPFETAEQRQARLLIDLLASVFSSSSLQTDKWAAYASKAVREVIVAPTDGDLEIQVVVKKRYEEWWMGWENKSRHTKVMQDWVQRTGFPVARTGGLVSSGLIRVRGVA
jgi:hypothetical protein